MRGGTSTQIPKFGELVVVLVLDALAFCTGKGPMSCNYFVPLV
jgi:hypothetical protein